MRLYRFPYSCYARFVQAALALARVPCEVLDVPFGDRDELARLTGGYVQVPVVVTDAGEVLTDSRRIVATLAEREPRLAALVPAADAGPVWAYVDWAHGGLEDVAFRLASPGLARRFARPFERALFVFIKERKFGPGCVDAWARDDERLAAELGARLAPTARTLATRRFVCGDAPTLADAALYGQLVMLEFGAPERVAALAPELLAWKRRFEDVLGAPPYGRAARHQPSAAELAQPLAAAPRTRALAHVVVRTAEDQRACPPAVAVTIERGLAGDRWYPNGRPEAQVSLMDAQVAAHLAARDDWELFGDNLFVDLDLSTASVQAGDRIVIGAVTLIATDHPHLGCRKLMARFGPAALRWVNHKDDRALRRRGLYARVEVPGELRLGDRATIVRAG